MEQLLRSCFSLNISLWNVVVLLGYLVVIQFKHAYFGTCRLKMQQLLYELKVYHFIIQTKF